MTTISPIKGSEIMKEMTISDIDSEAILSTDWSVDFPVEYQELFKKDSDYTFNKFSSFMTLSEKNFRVQLEFYGVRVLCGFFLDEKKVRVSSPRLNQELFVIQESENATELDYSAKYKAHTQKIASLDIHEFPSMYEEVTSQYELEDILNDKFYTEEIVTKQKHVVQKLLTNINSYNPSWFEKVSDWGLGLTAQYALLRIHLLKFLAILPSLDHDEKGVEVKRILLEALRRLLKDSNKAKRLKLKGQEKALPQSFIWAFRICYIICQIFPSSPLASLVRFKVRFMAKRFIAGESIEKAEAVFGSLFSSKRDVTLDQLGELVVSEKEADNYEREVLNLIRGFKLHIKKGEKNKAGVNRAHVSIKVSALCSDFKPYAFDYTYDHVAPRLKNILLAAMEEDVFINIDAEHYHYRDIVFKVWKKVLLDTPELKNFKATGIVIQAYLRDAALHLKDVIELAKLRGILMPVRLVKGAYWDAETVEADAHGHNAPEFLNKEETDLHFRQLIIEIFKSNPHLQLCIASHNFADHCFAHTLRSIKFSHIPEIEHQCLHMTYEALSTAMGKMDWAVRNYVPVGSLIVGMAYLVRRIMENSSQVGVLTIMRSHKKSSKMVSAYDVHKEKVSESSLTRDQSTVALTSAFLNVAPVRTYLDIERKSVEEELALFEKEGLAKTYINSFETSGEDVSIMSSSDTSICVGNIKFATREDANRAVDTLDKSYNSGEWASLEWQRRSFFLVRAANLMSARRNSLAALISYEAGKAIDESLADVDEAIDFLNFYAREEGRLHKHNSEVSSRGVSVAITPWNFPLAIPCGMAVSSLVTGNCVILKSAEQTPLIAQALVDLLHEVGVPKNVLIHLPGLGEEVGDELVKNSKVSTIVFTGSKSVGMMISNTAGKRIYNNKLTGHSYPVKVVTEMGGKNAVIVTANAELDETVSGILYSSFAHAGQKCSACSRVIVDNTVKDKLIERLKEAASDIKVGKAFDFSTSINPVISKEDKDRLIRQVKEASLEANENRGKVHIDRSAENLPGYCVGPSIIEVSFSMGLNKESYAQKELFGPVVHVVGFDTLDGALKLYNSTDYALTGGVFSQSQDDIDYLTSKMESGNIYINRSITGARVAIEPFGGFKLSGTGPKAGGKAYLSHMHINNRDVQTDNSVEKGSDYDFDICRRSGLKTSSRIERMEKALKSLIQNFEFLYQDIKGEEKKVLKSYSKWVSNNFHDFLTLEHSNRKIPGQLSYNDFNVKEKYALHISYSDKGDFNQLLHVLSSVLVGTGMTIICRNEKVYNWWHKIISILHDAGFSQDNIDVYFASEESLEKALENKEIRNIFVDSDIQNLEHLLTLITKKDDIRRMRQVFHNSDLASMNDFKRICSHFICVRSFAVNTMRHGAPMDLEL